MFVIRLKISHNLFGCTSSVHILFIGCFFEGTKFLGEPAVKPAVKVQTCI